MSYKITLSHENHGDEINFVKVEYKTINGKDVESYEILHTLKIGGNGNEYLEILNSFVNALVKQGIIAKDIIRYKEWKT